MQHSEDIIDKSVLERLGRLGGSELKVKAIDQYLEKIPMVMDTACDRGRAGDLSEVRSAVDFIKSAANSIGATEVSAFAGRIENAAVLGAQDLILPFLCQLNDMLGDAEIWLKREKITLLSARGMNWH